ncbi:MAG TPA: MarR family transcriptional regulator [Acidimicrobiales bacterium]|nr:MarR family transcriptional regulator [Acidimicrobiales bacterium]
MTNKQISRTQNSSTVARTAARLGRQVDAALAVVDLSSAQYRMLFQLAEGAEASTTLARKLEVSAPSVTAVVDGLVNRGLIIRSHSHLDRRKVSLDLTEAGRAVLVAADESVIERLMHVAGFVDEGQAYKLIDDLSLWAAALDTRRAARLVKRARNEADGL